MKPNKFSKLTAQVAVEGKQFELHSITSEAKLKVFLCRQKNFPSTIKSIVSFLFSESDHITEGKNIIKVSVRTKSSSEHAEPVVKQNSLDEGQMSDD
jgi:hypothetical protein